MDAKKFSMAADRELLGYQEEVEVKRWLEERASEMKVPLSELMRVITAQYMKQKSGKRVQPARGQAVNTSRRIKLAPGVKFIDEMDIVLTPQQEAYVKREKAAREARLRAEGRWVDDLVLDHDSVLGEQGSGGLESE